MLKKILPGEKEKSSVIMIILIIIEAKNENRVI